MTRAELLKSADYWKAKIQIELYNCAELFMKKKGMNRRQLAAHLGVSNGYVTQLLNGDYDHKLTKLAELALKFGYVPNIKFIPVEQYIEADKYHLRYAPIYQHANYSKKLSTKTECFKMGAACAQWTEVSNKIDKEVA